MEDMSFNICPAAAPGTDPPLLGSAARRLLPQLHLQRLRPCHQWWLLPHQSASLERVQAACVWSRHPDLRELHPCSVAVEQVGLPSDLGDLHSRGFLLVCCQVIARSAELVTCAQTPVRQPKSASVEPAAITQLSVFQSLTQGRLLRHHPVSVQECGCPAC